MGLHNYVLFQSRAKIFVGNGKLCGLVSKENLEQSRRLMSFRHCSRFPSRLLCLDGGVRGCRGSPRERCLVSRHSHGFSVSAMSKSGDSDDGAQRCHAAASHEYPCLYVKSAVSSGETVQYSGTVVVLGDVQEGGAVTADGDIVVLGRLHGDVHGGRSGDRGAVVYATQLDACRVRIADATAVVSKSEFPGCPVIASVQEDGTLGIRAAVQESKEARTSGELHSAAVTESSETSKGSERKEQASSKRPAQLALFTGVYISLVGMALLVFPTSLFGVLFDVRSVTVGWIRVGAILAVVFGVYYIGTAVGDMRGSCGARAFYMSTVVGRVFLFFGFCWLVAAGAAQRALLLLGIVNMLGAMSMLVALRQDTKARVE